MRPNTTMSKLIRMFVLYFTQLFTSLPTCRECFPGEQLLPAVMRYLTDPTQTPNSRVKIATLVFITQIAETAEPSALINSAGTALARLLDWSNDVKSQDVRRHAQNAVISLYNLNPPKVTMILAELPKYYQVRCCIYIYTHVRTYIHTCIIEAVYAPIIHI